MIVRKTAINPKTSVNLIVLFVVVQCIQHTYYTDVRWASEPGAIVDYFRVVGEVDIAVVVAADDVLLTNFDIRRISHSQQTIFADQQQRD